jgi:hypothetical protein
MTKHTTQEILAVYNAGAGHSLEAAAQATYDLGFAAGQEDIKVKVTAGDAELRQEIAARHQNEKEAEHNRTAARKRELHDADQDDAPTTSSAKKAAHDAHPTKGGR